MGGQGRTIWDFWAPRYHRLWVQRFSLGPSRDLVHRVIDRVAPDARRILDVGCGIGQFARETVERRPDAFVVGVDPAPAMIERARTDFAHDRIRYLVGRVEDVPAGEGFDVVTCQHAFPYMPDPVASLRAMHERLRPGGRVLLVNANAESARDALLLAFVKLTTTSATYWKVEEEREMMRAAGLEPGLVQPLPTPFYSATITLVEGRG